MNIRSVTQGLITLENVTTNRNDGLHRPSKTLRTQVRKNVSGLKARHKIKVTQVDMLCHECN